MAPSYSRNNKPENLEILNYSWAPCIIYLSEFINFDINTCEKPLLQHSLEESLFSCINALLAF